MKYILGVVGFILLAIFAVVLLTNTISNRNPNLQEGDRIVDLVEEIEDGGTYVFVTEGKIVGEEDFRSIRISISPSMRKVEVLKGYNQAVEKEQSFSNTTSAYEAFVHSIAGAGFSRERDVNTEEAEVVDGKCPLGRRFLYELNQGSDQLVNLWSTSCRSKEGTFGGNKNLTEQLFQSQIPEYTKFVSGVRLG